MSWLHLRATASGLRAVPEAALVFQSPLRSAPSRPAAVFRLKSRAVAAQKVQRRHLSDSSPAATTNTDKEVATAHGSLKAEQSKNKSKKDQSPKAPKPPKELRPLQPSQLRKRKHRNGEPVSVTEDKSGLLFHLDGIERPLRLPKLWLRDACPCESCVNPSSGQKTFATTDLPLHPEIDSYSLESNGDLRVTWANDSSIGQQKHESLYTRPFVENYFLNRYRTFTGNKVTWDQATLEKSLRVTTYSEWMAGGEAFARAFHDLLRYGIIFLREMPQREDAVEDIAREVGHLQSTFYGMTWDVISKPKAENVAYTNVFLGLHHDLMYWKDVPKIQILHCLENSCEGGDSIFSDGLRAALEIRAKEKAYFKVLSSLRVPYHYDIAPHKYSQQRPVFDLSEFGSVKDIYWSPPFQAPFFALNRHGMLEKAWNPENLDLWHQAARSFKDNIEAPGNMYQYKMEPGDCVLFDNRRVFHGRREFNTSSGKRWLKGGYISQEVLTSKAKSLLEAGSIGPERGETAQRQRIE